MKNIGTTNAENKTTNDNMMQWVKFRSILAPLDSGLSDLADKSPEADRDDTF